RLLYVALTRARDRRYLAGALAGGKLVLQRGSIGKVLPASLSAAMAAGAAGGAVSEQSDQITWQGASSAHLLRKVRISLP
ncbi:MAG: hypothetical protein ACKOEC_12760, partial [Acidimicrobiia bacterium]